MSQRDELSEFDDDAVRDASAAAPVEAPKPEVEAPKPAPDTKGPIFNLPNGVLPDPQTGPEAPVIEEPKIEEPKPAPAAGSAQERIAELTRERNDERRRNDEFIRSMLRGDTQANPAMPKLEPIDIEPETRAAVEQVIRETVEPLNPLLAEAAERSNVAQCELLMPGFAQLWPDVKAEFAKMPVDEQPKWDTQAGAISIAHKLKERNTASQALANRAHNEAQPNPTVGQNQRRKLTEADIINMTDEQFNVFVEAQKGRGEGDPNYVDPLVR